MNITVSCSTFVEWSSKAGYGTCTSDIQLALWDAWQAGQVDALEKIADYKGRFGEGDPQGPRGCYQVRVREGILEVLFPPNGGEWITHDKFVDALADRGAWDQVCELAKLGRNILSNETTNHQNK